MRNELGKKIPGRPKMMEWWRKLMKKSVGCCWWLRKVVWRLGKPRFENQGCWWSSAWVTMDGTAKLKVGMMVIGVTFTNLKFAISRHSPSVPPISQFIPSFLIYACCILSDRSAYDIVNHNFSGLLVCSVWGNSECWAGFGGWEGSRKQG